VREHRWFQSYTYRASRVRFSVALLTLLLLETTARPQSSGTVLLGSQNIASTGDSDAPGQAEAFQFAASASGTLGSLTVYVDSSNSSTQLVVGLYSSSGQNPATLLTQGAISSPVAGAWNTIAVPSVSVTAGTVYWIAILGTGGTLDFRDTGSNCISETSAQSNLTTLPSAWSIGSRWYTCTLSAYGSTSSTAPVLAVSQSSVSFSATQGSGTNPSPVSVNVSNTGGGNLSFSTSSDSSWLSVTPSSGTAPQTLQVSAALGSLAAGTYTGHITVSATGAENSASTITATFVVSTVPATPALSVSPTSLTFSATEGGSNPAASSVNITNSAGGSLTFTASSDSSWLSVSPTSGSAPGTLQISATLGALTPGTYTGHITITAAGVQGSPATVTANFTVSPDAAPVISSVTASSITSSGATITWITNKPGTSQVNYGTTTAYGSASLENSTLATSHSVTLSGLTASTLYHYQVQSADSVGTLAGSADATFTTLASSGSSLSCPCSIWSSTATPANPSVNDGSAVELGVKFTSSVSGYITGVQFYKGSRNTGTHTGSLWTSSGTLLATATFSNESSSGWQQVSFARPVAINANTAYVASYHTAVGYYAGDNEYFASSGTSGTPLQALSNQAADGNGVYVYGSGGVFPSSSYEATNYWVDVVFATSIGSLPTTYSISGAISVGGATVTLGGSSTATTTDSSSGSYRFSGLASGSYAVTPSEAGYTFTPSSQSVTINNANVTGVNFTATAQTFSISGTISGTGGETVSLSGHSSASTTADASGNFTFGNLANGSYSVTPSKTGYTFAPTSQAVTINGTNVTGLGFTASVAPITYTISGSISPASVGSGATVTLSGGAAASTTADSNGNFSFSSLTSGAYTVTPTSSTATFSPTSQNVTIGNANITGVGFTATASKSSNCGNTLDWTYAVCQQIGAGSLNPQWTVISRHGEYAQGENECNIPQQITQTPGLLTITTANSAYTCGDFDTSNNSCSPSDGNCAPSGQVSPASWPYVTGDIQWNTLSIAPSSCGSVSGCVPCSGTCTISITGKMPAKSTGLWPAFWMLGANCQNSNKLSGDTQFDGCPAVSASGYTEIDIAECLPGSEWCHFASYNPPSAPENDLCIYSIDTNTHTYKLVWSATSMTFYLDGSVPSGCGTTTGAAVPSAPMFLIMQTQTSPRSPEGPPVNSQLPASMVVNSVTVTDANNKVLFEDNFPNQN